MLLVIGKLLLFLLYRLVRSVIQLESDLLALFKRLSLPSDNDVEYFNILTRYRLDKTDITHDHDFLVFNDSFGSFHELLDSRWHIYSISDRYVYFVRISPETPISIDCESKLPPLLFSSADRVARMDVTAFIERSRVLSPLKCRLVLIHSVPSCGATMTAKLLQAADPEAKHLVVLGEPPVFTWLAVLSSTSSIEKVRSLTKGCLRFALVNYDKQQTVVVKTRSCCAKIVPYVHHANPSVQHLFVTSRNPTEGIQRVLLNTSKEYQVFDTVCRLLSYSSAVCDFFFGWRLCEPETITKIGPTTSTEFALAQIMGATINYQRNLKYYPLDTIYFEDLMSDTATVIRPLLDICDMSDLVIPECIAWKRQEEPLLRQIWDIEPLNEENRERVKNLVDLLQQDWNH